MNVGASASCAFGARRVSLRLGMCEAPARQPLRQVSVMAKAGSASPTGSSKLSGLGSVQDLCIRAFLG